MNGKQISVKTGHSSGLTVEKSRIMPLTGACFLLLALFFAAGFVIGYGGYARRHISMPAARVSPPPMHQKESPAPVTQRADSGAVPEEPEIRPDTPEAKPEPAADKGIREENTVLYPFTLRLASYRTREDALRGMGWFQNKGLSPYLIRIDRGGNGIWWSIYAGHYSAREEAVSAKDSLHLPEAIVKEMPYANFAGLFSNSAETEDISRHIESVTGYRPYPITESNGSIRLFAGSFVSRESAEELNMLLKNNGIRTEVVKR
ncbi:MAG: SPOR domain-containing protein [Desulfobacterales bacterium]